jgi:uncharacterized protein YkwD
LQALLLWRGFVAAALVFGVGGCSRVEHFAPPATAKTPSERRSKTAPAQPPEQRASRGSPNDTERAATTEWATDYAAPRPADPADPALSPLLRACGDGDEALHEVAQAVARHRSDQGQAPDLDWTLAALARRGAPYVVPRVWSAEIPAHREEPALAQRIHDWSRERPVRGESRCGVGELEREDGTRTLAVIQVDAQAELDPLPLAPALGDQLTLRARLLVPATDVEVVVLPPEGRPRPVLTESGSDRVQAKLRVDRPGPWVVQMLANDEGGPLPVLSVTLWAGGPPVAAPETRSVPGEAAATPDQSPENALLAMSNGARKASGLAPLARSSTLDALAREHAQEMQKQGRIAHDAGTGSPARRVEDAGIAAGAVGENVARGATIARVHRALWASPSHRGNLLFPHFDEIGIGVVPATGGGWYVTLLFIESRK